MDHNQFKELRRKFEKTQKELAEILGVTLPTLQRWEADPSSSYSRKIPRTIEKVMLWIDAGSVPEEWPKPVSDD